MFLNIIYLNVRNARKLLFTIMVYNKLRYVRCNSFC